jgi:predicted PurR-regulated permease PerM
MATDTPAAETDGQPADGRPDPASEPEEPPVRGDDDTPKAGGSQRLRDRGLIRGGAYAWAAIGLAGLVWLLGFVITQLSLVVIPLVLALFPAAVLAPPANWLMRHRWPPWLASLAVILTTLGLLAGGSALLAPQVAEQVQGPLSDTIQQGIDQVESFLASGPFGFDPIDVENLVGQAQEQLGQVEGLGASALGALGAVAEGLSGVLLGLVALFFYLKDGRVLARWLRSLFPRRAQADAHIVGVRAWATIGGYIRGQLLVALFDAVLIGIGLVVLRIPLALPLAVVVFFGALFPIVGAFVAGALAVLVALTTPNGFVTALLVVALITAVQQLEGNVFQPVVVGRATHLHPLAVIGAITAGAVLAGILGAFLAVPVAASAARAGAYLRARGQGAPMPEAETATAW